MLSKYSLTDIVSAVGFCVGCAFVTYVIRMFGYFNVVGPELLGMYLDSDLVQGAILALPAVILVLGLIQMIVSFLFPVFDRIAPKVDRVIERLPKRLQIEATTFFVLLAGGAFVGSIIVQVVTPDDDHGALLLFHVMSLMACCVFATENFLAHRRIKLFWVIAVALNSYWTLYQVGRFEAQNDLRLSKTRYAVHAEDKSFVNVTLLRSTSKALLMKVGDDVVMYDRSQVIRIERMPKVK
ncbi:hypothetical protein [Rhizobium oryzihabitans]|uniref:hypothetical protein n=1 Tax=Rhizobium oryzihabitans TaxID=2267833 RepID=UPI004036C734